MNYLDQWNKYNGPKILGSIFIANNKCFVNGTICTQRGKKLYPGFLISINGSLFFEITK